MNYTEILAAKFRDRLPGWEVYSAVDPSREWNGTPTVEFIETDSTTENYISGASRKRVALAVAVRAEAREAAEAIGDGIKIALAETLDEIKNSGVFENWAFVGSGTTPDARGVATGESFYWYLDFHIVELYKRQKGA